LQGEQIWQIFADWAIVYTLDSFFWKLYLEVAQT
jgi:hypothetical protein